MSIGFQNIEFSSRISEVQCNRGDSKWEIFLAKCVFKINKLPPYVFTKYKIGQCSKVKLEICSDGTVSLWIDDKEIGESFTD